MEIINIEDQPDGSAIVTFDMTNEEEDLLIEYALLDLLKKGMESENNIRPPVSE